MLLVMEICDVSQLQQTPASISVPWALQRNDLSVTQGAICIGTGLPGIDGSLSSVNLRKGALDVALPGDTAFAESRLRAL